MSGSGFLNEPAGERIRYFFREGAISDKCSKEYAGDEQDSGDSSSEAILPAIGLGVPPAGTEVLMVSASRASQNVAVEVAMPMVRRERTWLRTADCFGVRCPVED
ncbi:MAG UNVERIFIED_CONTAM: hypothetical protein LVR18_29215 [Planctomycetaceae bacterium]